MLRTRFALAPLVALALTACGQAARSSAGDFQGTERQVADAVESLQSAAESRNGQKVCREVLAPALADRMRAQGQDCATQVRTALDDADDFELTVQRVDVRGDQATAQVANRGPAFTLVLARQGGAWRITSFG
jgi:dihydroxyacetone kinase